MTVWTRLLSTHKLLLSVVGIAAAGWASHVYLSQYAKATELNQLRAKVSLLSDAVIVLQTDSAAKREADDKMYAAIQDLVRRMLDNPPPRSVP